MKRVFLLIMTNIAIMVVLSIVCTILGVDRWMTGYGLNMGALLAMSAVLGFGGSFISLLLSKFIAKHAVGAQVIDPAAPGGETERWLLLTVERLAREAGVDTPEVAIYAGEPNAFATGARRNAALVAVSTGLLQGMSRNEVEAVLGHEMAHVANGDMVTLTLIQGVLNTFVIFLSRVVGYIVDSAISGNDSRRRGRGIGYTLAVFASQIVFGILASAIVAWFSRRREYRADAGSAQYLGAQSMIAALRRLGGMGTEPLPTSLQAAGIAGGKLSMLFATHPSIEDRIAALERLR
ncbi:MAG: protease HtpX [Acidobacteriota bacterium]|jgi:heat shock protein HtpX|nr:protease HtpX [Acidobacteriota bacterium]